MVLVGRPIEGAQPTSLTQSLWASSFWSSFHCPSSSLQEGREKRWQRPKTQQVSPDQDLRRSLILPELNQVVTASRDEAFDVVWLLSCGLIDQAAGNNRGTPTHSVTADLQESHRCVNRHTWIKALAIHTHTWGFYSRCVRCWSSSHPTVDHQWTWAEKWHHRSCHRLRSGQSRTDPSRQNSL